MCWIVTLNLQSYVRQCIPSLVLYTTGDREPETCTTTTTLDQTATAPQASLCASSAEIPTVYISLGTFPVESYRRKPSLFAKSYQVQKSVSESEGKRKDPAV
jgi:hypothetical protein